MRPFIHHCGRCLLLALPGMLTSAASVLVAQQSTQPPPFTAPNPPTPAAPQAPNQQSIPAEQRPTVAPDAPLPQPDKTSMDVRKLVPLAQQPAALPPASSSIDRTANTKAQPRDEPPALHTSAFNVVGPYRAARLKQFRLNNGTRIGSLVRDGRLYLSLHDAVALAIENNLDVEIDRYNLFAADLDITRAKGGGNLRGIDYTVQQSPTGVGSLTSPLLVTATGGTPASTNASVTDLSQVTQSGSEMQQNLSESNSTTYSQGPAIPLFDPTFIGEVGYLRRSDQVSLLTTTTTGGTGTGGGTAEATPPLDFVNAGLDYQQGFASGAQLELFGENASAVLYGSNSQLDPFQSPSTYVALSQPLLRSLGPSVNSRFIHIAKIDRKISLLLFEQQLLETVYGVSRLYFDLVSLGENVAVKEQSLAAAQKLYDDDQSQVEEGTLAPIELTRAQALLSSSRLDLIQAQGEYRQQEVILKEQLLRKYGDPSAYFSAIIATDRIVVPDDVPALDVPALTNEALANRPDLAQASLQINADEIAVKASRNGVKPMLNAYANVQTRGSSIVPYQTLGSQGTGMPTPPTALTQGGLRLSTIYQGGVQLTLPLRNRIAQADSVRDQIQLRQAEGRTVKLENDIRQQIENSAVALETAHQAYAAAVESSNYQQQLLQAEIDKFAVGESTNYLIVQDEAYLAQARSTEVAARSDWVKARLALDRSLGNLLEKNNVLMDDAVRGELK